MNSPIELIEHGIKNNDWKSVCEAYTILTGRLIAPPETISTTIESKTDRFEDLKAAIKKVIEEFSGEQIENFTQEKTQEDKIDLIKEQERIIKENKARRPPFKYSNVNCDQCKKEYQVHPKLKTNSMRDNRSVYVCDTCRKPKNK